MPGKANLPKQTQETVLRGIRCNCTQLSMMKSYLQISRVLSVISKILSFSLFQWSILEESSQKSKVDDIPFQVKDNSIHWNISTNTEDGLSGPWPRENEWSKITGKCFMVTELRDDYQWRYHQGQASLYHVSHQQFHAPPHLPSSQGNLHGAHLPPRRPETSLCSNSNCTTCLTRYTLVRASLQRPHCWPEMKWRLELSSIDPHAISIPAHSVISLR